MNDTNSTNSTTKDPFLQMLEEMDKANAQEHVTEETLEAAKEKIIGSAPTLSSSAMLTCLSIGVWEGKITDRDASEQVTSMNHAEKDTARVIKTLLGKCPELDAIKTHRGYVRNHIHYAMTMPWSDAGLRLLTTAVWMGTGTMAGYNERMTEAQATFWQLVDDFCDAYDWKVDEAKIKLGNMFNQSNYPTREEVRRKFKFSVDYIPLPEAGDFRVDMGNESVKALSEGYEKFYSQQFTEAMRSIWERLYKPLANMVERLDYDDTKKIFGKNLVDNVLAIVDLMGAVNVTNDPVMLRIENDLRYTLQGVTVEGLREDDGLRRRTHKAAAEALKGVKEQIDALPSVW